MVKSSLYANFTQKAGELIDYDLTLEYYMITEPLCAEYSDLLRYGVKIRMIIEFADGEREEEIKEIRDIFYRKNDADEFIEMLVQNSVTPTHFQEVVEEYIAGKLKAVSC